MALLGWIGTLITYASAKDRPAVRAEAAKALNWALVWTIGGIALTALSALLLMVAALQNTLDGLVVIGFFASALNLLFVPGYIVMAGFGVAQHPNHHHGRRSAIQCPGHPPTNHRVTLSPIPVNRDIPNHRSNPRSGPSQPTASRDTPNLLLPNPRATPSRHSHSSSAIHVPFHIGWSF